MRGGLRDLVVPGSFFLLLSSFLARSRPLSPLPRFHPSLFPQLRLRAGSDVTSAEIPPNSTAQWRAAGRAAEPGGAAGAPGASTAFGLARGRGGAQGRPEAGQGREAEAGWPKSWESEKAPRRAKQGEGAGRGRADRSRQRSRRTHSHCGKEGEKGGWGGGEEKGTCAKQGALINRRDRTRASGKTETYSWEQFRTDREEGTGTAGPRNGTKDSVHGFVWGEACGVGVDRACVTFFQACRVEARGHRNERLQVGGREGV